MLLVVYRESMMSRSMFPPCMIELTPELLESKVASLIELVHLKFTRYLSPFVNKSHLQLRLGNDQAMQPSFPLFMYMDYSTHLQQVHCTTESTENINAKARNPRELTNSLVLRMIRRESGGQGVLEIVKRKELGKVEELMKAAREVVLGNREIVLEEGGSWSVFLEEEWRRLNEQECVYLLVLLG